MAMEYPQKSNRTEAVRDNNKGSVNAMEPPVLTKYSEIPVYDLNAMVGYIKVRPLTLWAWEQQLGMAGSEQPHEQRTSRRRYSERDLIALMWVRDQVVAGESLHEAAARLLAAQRGTRGFGYPVARSITSGPLMGVNTSPALTSGQLNSGYLSHGPAVSGQLNSGPLNSGQLYEPAAAETYDPAQAGTPETWGTQPGGNLGAATYTGGSGSLGMHSSYGAWGAPNDPMMSGEHWNGNLVNPQTDTRPGGFASPHAPTGAPQLGSGSGRLNTKFNFPVEQAAYIARDPSLSQSLASLRELRPYVPQLLQSFARFDTARASAVLAEAMRRVGVENVCIGLVQPAIARISELWSKSELSNPEERFALNYLRGFMYSVYHSTQEPIGAPFVVVGCAPNESSDFGALLLAVLWRRAGMRVAFVGRGIDGDQLLQQNWPITPALIALTANSSQRIRALARIGKRVAELPSPQPIFAFCGPVFVRNPELRRKLTGVYLGDDAVTATRYARQLLSMDAFSE